MPTYEYVCEACEQGFEEFQGFNDPVLTTCPQCGKKKLRRLFGTGAAVLFKGSGFYETDYRSESYKAAAKKEQEAAGKTSSAEGTGTTAKTDTAATNGAAKAAGGAKAAGKRAKSKG
jgi:putative FmdB family regulatory protein